MENLNSVAFIAQINIIKPIEGADKIELRHLDRNKLNNSFENILLGSRSDNMLDIPKEIRIKNAFNASSKIKKYDKKLLYDLRKSGLTYKEITNLTGASNRTITYAFNTYSEKYAVPDSH